jgi:acyl-CoA synthetase (AMP-forming)/AMP-acid ligase II
LNPADWLKRTAQIHPTATALLRGETVIADYAQFVRNAAAVGGMLRARGIGQGERVAVFMKNCTEYLEVLYGVWFAGAAVVPINYKLHHREVAWILEDAQTAAVFVSDDVGRDLAALVPPCVQHLISVDAPAFDTVRRHVPLDAPASFAPEDLLWLFYTSGRARLASVGRAFSSVEVRVANENGHALPNGEIGEILVKGITVMKGYWQNPGATAATIRDGWLWTGDMGAMDVDGFITLHDRSKDVIMSGGTNIYPREVEEALLLHADISEVAVVGRKHADWGEEVVAFVVAAPGTSPDAAMLDTHCLNQIARFKRPKDYVFTTSLPKNNYGKVLKTELRRQLEDRK